MSFPVGNWGLIDRVENNARRIGNFDSCWMLMSISWLAAHLMRWLILGFLFNEPFCPPRAISAPEKFTDPFRFNFQAQIIQSA